MQIRSNTWHARWFMYVQSAIGSRYKYEDGTSLCHYMRVLFLWGALLVFWRVGVVLFAVGALALFFIIMPFQQMGWFGPLVIIGGGLTGVVTLAGLVAGIELLRDRAASRVRKQDSIIAVSAAYVSAIKRKVCPLIRFDRQDARQ